MATFESTGHTVFREGDPAIPDIEAEKNGRRSGALVASRRGSRRLKRVRLRGAKTGRFVSKLLGRYGGRRVR